MRPQRSFSLNSIGAMALALGMILSILSGCGATSNTAAGGQSGVGSEATAAAEASTATAIAVNSASLPTATIPPEDPATLEQPGCQPLNLGSSQPQYDTVDGMQVSVPQLYTPLDYPEEMMPNNEPNAPYQVPLTASVAQQQILFHPSPLVNPSLSTGYVLQVCNQSSASHAITSLSVTIANFTPSSGAVTVWHLCQDGPYDAATRQTTTGCGGAIGNVGMLAATLPSDTTGASAQSVANAQRGGPNLPITLAPNTSLTFLVAVNGLTSQGTYSLSFGLSVDSAASTSLTPSDGAFFIAPSPTVWTGTACQKPAMQAQIPATSQDTYYVCPPGA